MMIFFGKNIKLLLPAFEIFDKRKRRTRSRKHKHKSKHKLELDNWGQKLQTGELSGDLT